MACLDHVVTLSVAHKQSLAEWLGVQKSGRDSVSLQTFSSVQQIHAVLKVTPMLIPVLWRPSSVQIFVMLQHLQLIHALGYCKAHGGFNKMIKMYVGTE